MALLEDISQCRLCAERFAQSATRHSPRPVAWFEESRSPRILVAGQAPGARVHDSGKPFTDRSGDRLRAWMGLSDAAFYDKSKIAIVPMAFCFPGYSEKGSDLPPPPICARTWRKPVLKALGTPRLTVLVGGHAIRWHLGGTASVAQSVQSWRDHAPAVFPLPHPSWRNTAWLRKNDWFEADVIPSLQSAVKEALE